MASTKSCRYSSTVCSARPESFARTVLFCVFLYVLGKNAVCSGAEEVRQLRDLRGRRRCDGDGRRQRRRSGTDRGWLGLPAGGQVRRSGGCEGEDRQADGCPAAPGHPEIPLPGGPSQRLRRRRQALGRVLGVRGRYPAAHQRVLGGRGPHRHGQLRHRQRARPSVRRLRRREGGA
ncbi:unnamed protein product [Ectocarpus fasciculatus]